VPEFVESFLTTAFRLSQDKKTVLLEMGTGEQKSKGNKPERQT